MTTASDPPPQLHAPNPPGTHFSSTHFQIQANWLGTQIDLG